MLHFIRYALLCLLSATALAQNGAPEIPFKVVPDFLKHSLDDNPDGVRNFGELLGVAVNSKGHIVVLNHPGTAHLGGPIWANTTTQILEFDADGKFLGEIGKGVYGLAYAHQIRFDEDDNLWVVDKGANSVIQFDPDGYVIMNLGRREEGYHGMVELDSPKEARAYGGYLGGPTDVDWDSEGNIYVSDGYVNSRMAKFDSHGNFLMDWGSYGSEPGQFNLPHAMQIDDKDNIYVADRSNRRIQVFDTAGNHLRDILLDLPYPTDYQPPFTAVNPDRKMPEATQPWAMCITKTSPQYLYVADAEPGRIYKITTDGKIVGWLGSSGRQPGQFNWIHGLDCSQEGVLYVADMNNWRVQKLILEP